jgi:hypothetical protein
MVRFPTDDSRKWSILSRHSHQTTRFMRLCLRAWLVPEGLAVPSTDGVSILNMAEQDQTKTLSAHVLGVYDVSLVSTELNGAAGRNQRWAWCIYYTCRGAQKRPSEVKQLVCLLGSLLYARSTTYSILRSTEISVATSQAYI